MSKQIIIDSQENTIIYYTLLNYLRENNFQLYQMTLALQKQNN